MVFLVLLSFPAIAFSQSADLQKLLTELQQNVKEVKTASNTYQQQINLLEHGVIRYDYTQTDGKGKSVAMAYELNLADIDAYAVREESKKDVMQVSLNVKNNQKLVKEYKNGAVNAYTKEVAILGSDVDNARKIVELIKKAIPLAEKQMENRLKLTSYADMVKWLSQHVQDVNLGDNTIKQSFAAGDFVGSFRYVQHETGGKSPQEHQYEFNLADINPNSLAFKISGNKLLISMETQGKQKLISYIKNGEQAAFANSVEIMVNNVEEARDLRGVLALAIPQAVDKVKADMPKVATQQDALKAVAQYVQDFKNDGTGIEQKMGADCITTYQVVEQSPKGTSAATYQLNLMDLNESLVDYDISGSKFFVELQTKDKLKLVKHLKGEEMSAYENSFKIYVPNVEVARRLKYALEKSIESCRKSHTSPISKQSTKEKIAWIAQHIGEVSLEGKTYRQQLELPDPSDLKKIKFTSIESDSKKTTEEIFEFNLTDIDPRTVNYSIKGKWLMLTIETNQKNKIIKYYQNGEIKPYTHTVEVRVNDVETARNLITALSGAITDLK